MKHIDSPHEVHIRVRRVVFDRAALRGHAGSDLLRENLSDRIAARVDSARVRRQEGGADRFDVTDTIADAIATHVSLHLAGATRGAAE